MTDPSHARTERRRIAIAWWYFNVLLILALALFAARGSVMSLLGDVGS